MQAHIEVAPQRPEQPGQPNLPPVRMPEGGSITFLVAALLVLSVAVLRRRLWDNR